MDKSNDFQNYMDVEDIYNHLEAGGQNVNVRNGCARARGALSSPSKIQIYIFCRKVDIFRKPFYWKKFHKKFYILRLIVKEIFHFEVLSVTDACGALLVALRCKSSMYPRIVYRFGKRMVITKKLYNRKLYLLN